MSISYIIAIFTIAYLVSWPYLVLGCQVGMQARGDISFPYPKYVRDIMYFAAVWMLLGPIQALVGGRDDVGFFSALVNHPVFWTQTISLLSGTVLGVCGLKRVGIIVWLCFAPLLIGIILYCLPLKSVIIDLAVIAAYVLCFAGLVWTVTIRNKQAAEVITDPEDSRLKPKVRSAMEILSRSGEIVRGFSWKNRPEWVEGFLPASEAFHARPLENGMLIVFRSIPLQPGDMLFPRPGDKWVTGALIPWENLQLVKIDKIICHTEIRFRFKNTGHEFVLTRQPKSLIQYFPMASGQDGELGTLSYN